MRGVIPNVQGTPLTSDSVADVQRPITPGARALREFIGQRWGVTVGAPRGASVRKPLRNTDGTLRRRDVHEEGRALDVMIRSRAQGEEIANYLASNALELGLQYIIWDGLELSSSTYGAAWEPYGSSSDRDQWGRARNPHTDHVHVEISPAFAADGAAMRARLGLSPRSDANESHAVSSSSSSSNSSHGAAVERTREFTGPREGAAWLLERYSQAYNLLRSYGVTSDGAMHAARALVALWVSETGWNDRTGRGESNFNPGNITGASPYGYFRIPGNSRHFRAYAEAIEGVSDAIAVLSTRHYRAAWDQLITGGDPVEWYSQILRAGYTPWAQGLVDEYAGILRLLPQRSGA